MASPEVQRLCCIAGVLYLTMIISTMWFGKSGNVDERRGFNLGPLSFNFQSIVISTYTVLIVTPLGFLLLLLFKYARRTSNKVNVTTNETSVGNMPTAEEIQYDSRASGFLPWCSVIIGYIVVAIIVTSSTFFTLLHGMGPI